MSPAELFALLPFLVLSAAVVAVMLLVAFARNHQLIASASGFALIVTFAALFVVAPRAPVAVTSLIIIDGYALYFMGLILLAGIATVPLSYHYLEAWGGEKEEYYLLLLLAVFGCSVMVASTHFVSFFLGLEILGVALYALIAYTRGSLFSLEAGIKYLILASVSDGFILFGMALVYAQTGTMDFSGIAAAATRGRGIFLVAGTALLIAGLGFKLSLVPFHTWTPDVYQGAPAPVTGLLATVSKGAVFALLLRYCTGLDFHAYPSLAVVITIIAVASMIVGNFLALLQNNVKRILAYSSISHIGYLLVAFMAGGKLAATAVGYYLAAYFVMTIGAFGVVTVLSSRQRDADSLDDYRGLAWRRPWLAGVFTAMLLSLAGIPLTAGFVGKFYLITAGITSMLWLMVAVLIVTSVIGLFYYLRIVVAMYSAVEPVRAAGVEPPSEPSWTASLVLTILAGLLLALGVYPAPILRVIERTVALLS